MTRQKKRLTVENYSESKKLIGYRLIITIREKTAKITQQRFIAIK